MTNISQVEKQKGMNRQKMLLVRKSKKDLVSWTDSRVGIMTSVVIVFEELQVLSEIGDQ